ncbi:hypothetical protein BDV10DRAFT_57669 [Aspergillus recurvatus]
MEPSPDQIQLSESANSYFTETSLSAEFSLHLHPAPTLSQPPRNTPEFRIQNNPESGEDSVNILAGTNLTVLSLTTNHAQTTGTLIIVRSPLLSPHFCRPPSLTWGGRTLCGESTAGVESPPALNLPKHPRLHTLYCL